MPGMLCAPVVYNPGTAATYTYNNQSTNVPTMSKVDATNLVLPAFTTGANGKVHILLTCYLVATASSADSLLKWCFLDAGDVLIAPADMAVNNGRRVALHNDIAHRAKLDIVATLTANTSYTLYWGAGAGNQSGAGTADTWVMKAGGVFGPAVMRVWDLAA